MAITLDELLGMNTQKNRNEEPIERFPSYDDFSARSRSAQQEQQPRYTFDQTRPSYSPAQRTDEYMRNYELTRTYQAPRSTEYRPVQNDVYETAQRRRMAEPPAQSEERQYGYNNYQGYANPAYQTEEKRQSLYEFTRSDNDRLSDTALEAKLEGRTAVRAERTVAPAQRSYARVEEPAQERQSVFTPVRSTYKSESTKKARLNTKGKILLAVYLAVIVLVAVLIIVNAGDINRGTATTPSSSVNSSANSATEISDANISAQDAIDFVYGAEGFSIR